MNHQPIKHLLLDEEPRTLQQEQSLWEHIKDCPECQNVDTNWQSVKNQIKVSPMVSPAPGFTARWQANLIVRKQRMRQQRQTLLITLLATSSVITLGGLTAAWYAFTSPASILIAFTRLAAAIVQITTLTPQTVLQWFASIPVYIPILLSLGLVAWITAVSITGAATLWRIARKGVIVR